MQVYQLGDDTIRVCTPEEARQFWKDQPDKRHEVWLVEEFDRHILSDPATINDMIEKKKAKPGVY